MSALEAKIDLSVVAAFTEALDLATSSAPLDYRKRVRLTNGTAADQANMLFSDQRTLAASGSEELDLSGGLTDAFGGSILFTRIKAIIISAASTNTNDVLVGGATTNAFLGPFGANTHTVAVKPGGMVAFVAPGATAYPVTATTAERLRVANSAAGTSVTYDVILIGCE